MTLQAARKALADFNIEFTARMERERQRQSESLRAAIDEEVWALHDKGWSVRKICEEYGTKDWNTVNKIIKRRVVVPESDFTDQAIKAKYIGQYIEVQAFGERVAFKDVADYPVFDTSLTDYKANGRLANALRNDLNFYAKVIDIASIN